MSALSPEWTGFNKRGSGRNPDETVATAGGVRASDDARELFHELKGSIFRSQKGVALYVCENGGPSRKMTNSVSKLRNRA